MMSPKFQRNFFVIFTFSLLVAQDVTGQDICGKFNIGGPCDILSPPSETTTASPATEDPFCQLACSEGDSELFTYCNCGGVVTTTIPPTTTPEPETCYYSTQRPTRLSSVVKRLWDPTPVSTECDYPGVVGLFRELNGKMSPVCTASLLQEDTLLVNENNCYKVSNNAQLYALPDSYQASSVSKSYPVIKKSGRKLDPNKNKGELYTLKLATPLTFDTGCIQPVCVPNDNIATSDIDLTDCRMVGYGEINDAADTPSQLMEVLVTVDPSSTSWNYLKISRVDGQGNTACFSEDSAPLICSHSVTKEWITVGISISVGFFCSDAEFIQTKVRNLLREGRVKVYYNGLQGFTYQNPDTFPLP